MRLCICGSSIMLMWMLRVLLFLAAVQLSGADCPKSCVCHVPAEVHCTFRYLTALPDHFPAAVERINLGYNSITTLGENDFTGFTKLQLLLLHSNNIHSVEDRAFQDLTSLQVLKMSHNKLKEINKETFKGLDRLLKLYIDHNQIEFIHPEALYGLTNLQLINLESNHLQQLHPDTFITMRHSQVFKVSSVRTIHLSDNLLTTLPADIFSGCYQLENLFLHANPWKCDCRIRWLSVWTQRNTGVLKCKRDRSYPKGQLCPVCANPASRNRRLTLLYNDAFSCSKPWIESHLKKKNITLEEGDFTPVYPKDFIAPLGSIQLNLTDHFHRDASLSCTVQRPTAFENPTQTIEEEEGNNVTMLTTLVTTYLVCNIDYEHIQQLWGVLTAYSDSPLRLERGLMLARTPEMVYRYSQVKEEDEGTDPNIEAEMKASPAWLLQGEVSLQLDRTSTTFSTLHIKYQSVVNLRLEKNPPRKDRYAWTTIKQDNQTKTEHAVITGGVAQLSCHTKGEPKPSMEWILPDGSRVRAPYFSQDRRIIITAEGELSLRGAVPSDTGLYWCITTNYLDADIRMFRLTVLSPDVEEMEVNGLHLSVSLGDSLVLDCTSSGSPEGSVSWILPDHSILDRSEGNKRVYENGTLKIQGLTKRDRGFYRCLVANHLGVDLLVYQVTVIEEKLKPKPVVENEGSGMVLEVKIDSSLNEKFISHSEMPSFSPNYRNSQESRTITSDRPYPKPRFQGRRGFGGRLWQRRIVAARNRHVGSGRIFNKASKKVDPQKFAELMKKAQEGLRIKTGQKEEMEKYENKVFSDGSEIGSGEDNDNNHSLFDPEIVKPSLQITSLTQTGETYPVTTDVLKNPDIENSMRHFGHSRQATTYSDPVTTDKSTFPHFPTPTEYYTQEVATIHLTNTHPINHQHLPPETQLRVLEKGNTNTETSTDGALLITTDHFTSPVKDGPKQAELVVHTDADGQTTFTAITTTERLQEEITFHTIQTIKSPGLSAGSTIISQQQIQIIPQNKGKGRRRTFHSRRRIVKPGRITDIKSFINRVKQPTARKEENASVPIQINLTTDRNSDEDSKKTVVTDVQLKAPKPSLSPYLSTAERLKSTQKTSTSTTSDHITSNLPSIRGRHAAEVTAEDITSADSPDMDASRDSSSFTTNKNVLVTTTASTSKAIPKKNDWNPLFGGRDRPKKRSRLRKLSVATKASTAAKILVTTTTVASTTTTGPPTKPLLSKQSSIEDKYERLDSVDFELRTTGLTFHHITTTSLPCYSKMPTTAGTPPELRTLPSPPTVNPHVIENPEELLSSGSGALPDNINTIRQKTGGIKRWKGMGRRRPFQGRRPLKKPGPTKATQTTSTLSSSVDITVMESTMEKTTQPQQIVSSYSSLNIPPMKMNRTVKADFSSLTVFTTTKTPLVTFSAHKPTTALVPDTIKQPYTAASNEIDINKQPQTQKKQHSTTNTSVKRLIPTLQSGGARNGEDEDLTFDKMTIFETQSGYNFPVPFNKELENSKSTIYDKITDNKAPSFSASGFEPKSKGIGSKPRIIGGNAASFTVLSNSDAFLPCEAVGNPQPVITWMHFSSTGSTISIRGRMGKFDLWSNGTLSIQRANIKDHGQYLCLAENYYGSDKLLVTLSVVAYPSRILEPRMREIKSHTRSTVELTCRAEGRPMPTFSWILANRTQIREHGPEKGRVSVSSEGALTIKDVSVFDRGFYKCIASNPAGADTATVRLQVVAAPPNILEEKRQQLKPSLGQNLWLPCTGHGSPQPTVHWVLHDGSVILLDKTTSNKRTTLFKNGTLSIRDVTPADNGNYECIATSSTGSERRVVTLTVETQQSAPQIVKTSELVTELSYGEQLRLNCLATGDPKPKIMWRLPSRAVVDHWHRMSSRIAVLDNGTLIVNTVIDKDAGEYLCVAQSTVGDDLQLMRVSVSMKPAKIESKPDGKKQIHVGNELKVDCKATGAPKPEISWGLPDGTVVNSALQADDAHGGGRVRRYTLFDNGTLFLNQVGMSEEGDYTCYAENKVGKDEMHVHITVVTAVPRIRVPDQTYAKVKPGGNVRFDCEALGEPKPKILWMLPNNDEIAASNAQHLIHVNGSLDIRNVKLTDSGEYVCVARNPGGEDRKTYKLEIEGHPPVINGFRQNRTVIKDVTSRHARKLIHCKAEGDPPPTITWIMPDNIFLPAPYFGSRINVHHNGTLEIRNVRATDTAEFICMARNSGGEAVMIVQLEVANMLQRPIFENPFNERIVSRAGKTIVLNCSAHGYPKPEIVWTLPNGTRLSVGAYRGSHYHLNNDGTLVIYNSQKDDSGRYRCGAKNNLGYVEKLIILNIGHKPYILTRPRGIIRGMSGESLYLHCLSDGSPRPKIFWTLPGGHTLTRPQVLGRYQLVENGTLVVKDTTLNDRGNYVCRAHNDAGEAVLTIPVAVIAHRPQITSGHPSTVRVVPGRPIQLKCAATGIPKPVITWELPDKTILSTAEQGSPKGSELLHPEGTLIIQRPMSSDSGKYKCTARNHMGTDSKVTYVLVL